MQNTISQKTQIESICKNGYSLEFGEVFDKALENYKKIAVYAGLVLLVFIFLFSILAGTGVLAYLGIEKFTEFGEKLKEMQSTKVMPLETTLLINGVSLIASVLISPFMTGFLKMADCGAKGEEFKTVDMFSYYKQPYFTNILVATFLISLSSSGLAILLQKSGLELVGTIVSLLISFFTYFSLSLIVFGNLTAIEAIKSSVLLVSKKPLVLLGLIIVSGIFAFLGIFGLCLGMFFTLPFMYSMNYVLYKMIIGLDETSEIDQISGVEV